MTRSAITLNGFVHGRGPFGKTIRRHFQGGGQRPLRDGHSGAAARDRLIRGIVVDAVE